MSQRDLVAELRAARPVAPAEVRERVRLVAAADAAPPRRLFTRRRAVLVLVPAAAALAAAVMLTRPTSRGPQELSARQGATVLRSAATKTVPGAPAGAGTTIPVPPSRTHAQRYAAFLSLRLPTPARVSDGVKRALRVASSLGGYPVSVHASAEGKSATADLVLKVPRAHVQQAITRLSQLGTITGEQVDVQDLGASLNTSDRRIARLQARLKALRSEPQTAGRDRQIAALTAQVERLQRAAAATRRNAQLASVSLHLSTPQVAARHPHHGHGPLHGLVVAFRWIGIGAVYALALGIPALLLVGVCFWAARLVRRRREDALLARR